MNASPVQSTAGSNAKRLAGFLEHDPENLRLLADAAVAALDEADPEQAARFIERYAVLAPLPPALENLKGLAAMGEGRYADAAHAFAGLLAHSAGDPTVRFNLAWSKAMLDDYAAAESLIDDAVVAAVPQAAALKIQAMHHQGHLEDALACGLGFVELLPEDPALLESLAVVALDAEDAELARAYATRAGPNSVDGLSTLGTLALNANALNDALRFFDRALVQDPENGRALLGRGLALMAQGDAAGAANYVENGAAAFGDYAQSWIAAGWAHFMNGDFARARAAFERAQTLDERSADSNGSLAVLDVVGGDLDGARRHAETALQLDPTCLTAALAKSLILASDGDPETAAKVRQDALNTPIGPNGPNGVTIAQAMAGLRVPSLKH